MDHDHLAGQTNPSAVVPNPAIPPTALACRGDAGKAVHGDDSVDAGVRFRGAVGPNAVQPPSRGARRRTLRAHEHLYLEGQPIDYCYRLHSGVLASYVQLADGRRQILSLHFPGDLILPMSAERHTDSVEALVEASVERTPILDLRRRLAEESGLLRTLLEATSAELARSHARLLSLGRQSAFERVAGFLQWLTDSIASSDTVDLPMSRGEIADYLGLRLKTVCRCLTRLRASGVIRFETTHRIRVVEPAALRALATGD